MRRIRGFSMVELVTVIALTGILSVGLGNLLQHPMNGYAAVSRRAELTALADLAMRRLSRDLRRALPNSIRVSGTGQVIELLHTTDGARYRTEPGINDPAGPSETDHSAPSDRIGFGGDARWNVLGRFRGIEFDYGLSLASGHRVSIYPTGSGIWAEAAQNLGTASITSASNRITILDDGDEDQIQLSQDHRFTRESPEARLFLVDTPVTYLCDPADAALFRIQNYTVSSVQPTTRSTAPLSAGQIDRTSDLIEGCAFTYRPGTPSRAALVSIEIVLASAGERVRLLQQIQVPNAP